MKEIGFDSKKYIRLQTKEIKKRAKNFDRIYLEFGGHLISDNHAKRVLPGYEKDNKIKILEKLKNQIEIIYCVYSKHITENKKDYNSGKKIINLVISEIDFLEKKGFKINDIVVTRTKSKSKNIKEFERKIKKLNKNIYFTKPIKNYPRNLRIILGKNGYKNQPHIKTNKKINIVTGPFANSGKMSVCLSQVYLDHLNGIESGYFKQETFPIWNLEINHPINIAYEAATADLGDYNMIDNYHKKAYKIKAVNYNRDIENFRILKKIINHITSKKNFMREYRSPTDMGINMAKFAIVNDNIVKKASIKEIKNRYNKYLNRYKKGLEDYKTIKRMKQILKKIN